jgi:2-polyprenyl-3-methyl-5-hydroxy-6-metoxy-1,4-benzoquinol methylase
MPEYRPHDVDWSPEKIQQFWDIRASTGDGDYFSAMTGPSLVSSILKLAAPRPGARILDLGCGRGHLLSLLAARGFRIAGADSSPGSVRAAQAAVAAVEPDRIRVGDPSAIPFEAGAFDVVVLIETIEHVRPEGLTSLLAEVRRVLAPNGALFITTPNSEDLSANLVRCPDCGARFHPMQHLRSWDARSLKEVLTSAGFVDVRAYGTRLPDRGSRLERLLRGLWYAIRRDKRHLIAIARKA